MAIIDTLQTYNWRKLFETRYKGIFENVDALSCVDPNKYRYQMQDIIAYDTYNVHISVLGIVLFPSFDITLMQSRFEGSVLFRKEIIGLLQVFSIQRGSCAIFFSCSRPNHLQSC